jgi:hypothetical protein
MKLNPYLVRGYILLAIDICRLAGWVYMVVNLITNYVLARRCQNAELHEPLQVTKWQVGLYPT